MPRIAGSGGGCSPGVGGRGVSVEAGSVRFLPPVAAVVLQSVHRHRVLTARHVRVLHLSCASLRHTKRVLSELHRAGLIECALAAHGTALWSATAAGQALLRGSGRLDPRRHRRAPKPPAGVSLEHVHALNEAGIAFVREARTRGDECDASCWLHEVAHPLAPPCQGRKQQWLVSDALLSYVDGQDGHLHQRFVELDLGSISVWQLAAKLGAYKLLHHCSASAEPSGGPAEPLWRSSYNTFPWVLVVLAGQDPTAARRRIGSLISLWRSDPATRDLEAVPLYCVILEQLVSDGPYAPIFTSASEPEQPQDWLGNSTGPPAGAPLSRASSSGSCGSTSRHGPIGVLSASAGDLEGGDLQGRWVLSGSAERPGRPFRFARDLTPREGVLSLQKGVLSSIWGVSHTR